jgi:hypothetical protein
MPTASVKAASASPKRFSWSASEARRACASAPDRGDCANVTAGASSSRKPIAKTRMTAHRARSQPAPHRGCCWLWGGSLAKVRVLRPAQKIFSELSATSKTFTTLRPRPCSIARMCETLWRDQLMCRAPLRLVIGSRFCRAPSRRMTRSQSRSTSLFRTPESQIRIWLLAC